MSFKIHDTREHEIVINNSYSPYIWRTYDGSANNLSYPLFGKAFEPLIRKSPVAYNDGLSTPAQRGTSNPSPRLISNVVCGGNSPVNNRNLTDMVWVWGQFLDHELDLTPEGSEELDMSTDDGGVLEQYPGRTIPFKRSIFTTVNNIRQQPNNISSYIDGTNVYGTDTSRVYELRMKDGSGKLKTVLADNSEIIPMYNVNGFPNAPSTNSSFFLAGDIRANENIALTGMHTLFIREHNRLCDEIIRQYPSFEGQDEMIYQQARRLVNGIMQHITYSEFLPSLLGDFPVYNGYDHNIDASIATEFSTVGYRLGHTMLSSTLQIGSNSNNTIQLRDAFFNPSYVQTNGINDILIGATNKLMQEIDGVIVDDVRNFLFEAPTPVTLLDLASLNIQRGRDHGIPDYNTLRVAYGLQPAQTFTQLDMSLSSITKLELLYDTVDDIDPWVGALLENHRPNSSVGNLLYNILVDQFIRLRSGDRYWYDIDDSLKAADKLFIRQSNLSNVLTRNIDYSFRNNVFMI